LAGKKHGRYALDSYALIAFFEGEKGQKKVSELLEQAESGECELFLNVVNLGEIAYIVERERGLSQAQMTLARIDELPVTIVEVDRRLALTAAHLKARYPIAYADCFAAALAQEKDAALVTGDPEFKEVCQGDSIQVIWIGRS
jgi:predicted nucleic acid-binding protein